jgi:hypothetical protein
MKDPIELDPYVRSIDHRSRRPTHSLETGAMNQASLVPNGAQS